MAVVDFDARQPASVQNAAGDWANRSQEVVGIFHPPSSVVARTHF